MSKFNLKNSIKSIFNRKGKDRSKVQFNVYKDWVILLTLFFILLVAVAAVNVYLFTEINKDEIFIKQRPAGEEIEMLDSDKLEEVIEVFDNRSENFNNLLKDKPDVIDPAL